MTRYSEPILQVKLGFPPGTNNVYGYKSVAGKNGKTNARSYMRQDGLDYKTQVMIAIKQSWPDFAIPPKKPLYLRLVFFCTPKTYLRRDLDGNCKVLIDALFKEGAGNDRYVMELMMSKERSIEDAVLVTMREIEEDK